MLPAPGLLIAVVGAGTMGTGIAQAAAMAIDASLAHGDEKGKSVAETGDGVAGVFPRIQAMVCHEAIVALAAGIASAEEIDTAMRLGVNYPQGPIERAERVGLEVILSIMQALQAEYGDPRYRPAPPLRRWVAGGGARHA